MERLDGDESQSAPSIPPAGNAASINVLDKLEGLEVFTPRRLVNDSHLTHRANSSAKHRTIAYIIVGVFLVSLVPTAAQCVFYYQMAPTQVLKNSVLGLYGSAYLYTFFALVSFKYLHRSTSILSNSYAALALLLTLGLHSLTGLSLASPVVPLYFFIPAWAFLTCSSRSGMWWSAIVIGVFIGVGSLEPLPFSPPNIIPEAAAAGIRMSSAISAVVLLGICLYAHQISFLALTDQLDEDRELYAHKSRHDSLTGLANREQFDLCLQQALDDVARDDHYAALIYIDLNDFKVVNDTHGHQVGDSVLQIVARRIKGSVRDSDTAARLGGDEFGIVLAKLTDKHIVTRIVAQLEETLAQPMHIDEISLSITGSIGIAIGPDDGHTASSLTRHADRNMYDVKSEKTRLKLVRSG